MGNILMLVGYNFSAVVACSEQLGVQVAEILSIPVFLWQVDGHLWFTEQIFCAILPIY